MLAFHDVEYRVGDATLLRGFSLSLHKGELVAIVGPNGSGKTTAVQLALGLKHPTRGRVTIEGIESRSLSARERAAHMAWLPQTNTLPEPIGVLEHVALARFRYRESHERSRQAALDALARVGASGLASRGLRELSGGERQRVALATALCQNAPFLLLDEPASALDPAAQIELHTLVGRLWKEGHGILCVTHDVNLLAFVQRGAAQNDLRVVGLKSGQKQFDAVYDAQDLDGHIASLYGLSVSSVSQRGRRVFIFDESGQG